MSGGLFRLIFYLLLAYLFYLAVRFILSPPRRSKRPRPSRPVSGIMVKDEICNTYLPLEDALKLKLDDGEHFFCSSGCRDKFLEQKKTKEPAEP